MGGVEGVETQSENCHSTTCLPHLTAPYLTQAEISENEEERRVIQSRIDQLAQTNQNVAFLNLMSTFRLQVHAVVILEVQQ